MLFVLNMSCFYNICVINTFPTKPTNTAMRFFIFIFILVQYHFSYSQHSERFAALIKNLKHSDSSYVENHYSNGSIKSKGALLYYDMPEYKYSKKAGLWVEYYNNGEIKSESVYDDLGNLLSKSLYDLKGSISSEMTAILIDSELSNFKNYFLRNNEVSITLRIKNYKFGKGIDKIYLREMGLVKGGKRIGVWKIYTQSGSLEKEINYDNN